MGTRSITQKVLLSSGKVFLYQGLGLVLSFLLQIFLAHAAGPAGLGSFTLFVSWLGIVSVLTVPGLEGAAAYVLPRCGQDGERRRKALGFFLMVAASLSLLAALAILLGGAGPFARTGLPPVARIPFAFAVVVFSLGKLLDAVFLAMGDAPLMGFYNVLSTLLRFAYCLPVFFWPRQVLALLVLAVTLECATTLVLRTRDVRRNYPEFARFGRDWFASPAPERWAMFAIALPMFGIGLIDRLWPILDKVLLGAMATVEGVGIYKVSDSIASLCSIFVSPFIAFWPYISKLFSEDRLEELRTAYRTITLVIFVALIPFVLVLFEYSRFALSLFGPAFAQHGEGMVLCLALGFMFDALAGPAGAMLNMTKHFKLALLINTTSLALYVGLSYVLTRHFGLMGMALAKMLLMILANVACLAANRAFLGLFPYTWKHAWLLLTGLLILAARSLLPAFDPRAALHLPIALAETAIFLGAAFLLLRPQFQALGGELGRLFAGRDGN